MANSKYIFLAISLVLLLISCESATRKDISMVEPVAHYSADALINDLKRDQDFPREKVVSVEGHVFETNTKNGKFNVLIKGKTNQNHYIICEMNESLKNLDSVYSIGDSIAVKGILKGYLNDVILLNCVLDNMLQNE